MPCTEPAPGFMDERVNKYLFDIREAVDAIENYLGVRKSFRLYLSNKMLRRAVERELEIIGEAVSRIEKLNPEIPLSGKKQIIAMRNRVIHGYDKIDDEIVWGVVVRHLPVLRKEVQALMNP